MVKTSKETKCLIPTEEQERICNHIRTSNDNLLIDALAGTGKSETLRMANQVFIKEPTLYLVFGKDAKLEAQRKFPTSTKVQNFNGLGHSVWMQTRNQKMIPNERKMGQFLSNYIADMPRGADRNEVGSKYWEILEAIGFAKNLGYIPNGKFYPAKGLISQEEFYFGIPTRPTPLIRKVVDALLVESIKAAFLGGIDYNDQVYMPTLFGGTFPRFPRVLADEIQDTNPVNIAMLEKLAKGWFGGVGDPRQAIYAFRGAVRDGVGRIAKTFATQEFTLSVSFRCPRAVVEAARWRVPNYKWIKPGGVYEILDRLSTGFIPEGSAIICRNNAPLFRFAFALIREGRSVKVTGSDIGPRLTSILKSFSESRGVETQIAEWQEKKLETAKDEKVIMDTASCLRLFANYGKSINGAITYAQHLFKQTGTIELITGHKAKGREWDTVFHLDPWLIGNEEQELNLRYVIQTRAKERAYEINSRDIECLRQTTE